MDQNDWHIGTNINNAITLYKQDATSVLGASVKTLTKTGGYSMEIKIPWASVSTIPQANKILGLLLANNDRDGGIIKQFDWLNIISTGNYSQPNLWGSLTLSGTTVGTIPTSADTTAPIFSSISASSITTSSAVISWTTNELSDSQVEYGTTASYGSQSALNSSLLTSHSQTLSNLSAGTTYHYRVKSRDSAGILGTSLDNTFTTQTAIIADTSAPSAISNLSASNIQTNSLTLSWASPSDLPNGGAPSSYDIRYSTSPITSSNFSSSTQVTGEPSPAFPGTTQTYILAGLSPSTTYYISIKSSDSAGNVSLISNILSITTLSVATPTPTPTSTPSSSGSSGGSGSSSQSSGGGSVGGGSSGGGGGGGYFQTSPAPTSFAALGASNQVVLKWVNPQDNNFVRSVIIRKEASSPSSISDGLTIYEGDKQEFTDTTAKPEVKYYYAIYGLNRSLAPSSPTVVSASLGDKTNAEVAKAISQTSTPQSALKKSGYTFTKNLKLGDRNDDVKALQEKLLVSPTGYFGPLTRQAVINFQKKYNIQQTGTVGPLTRAKLNQLFSESGIINQPASPAGGQLSPDSNIQIQSSKLIGPFSIGMRSEQVKLLQQMLSKDPSIYTGPVTGYYGPLTKQAVINFQKKYNIQQTGIAGPVTRQKMNEVYR